MPKVDQFESVFKSAAKEVFKYRRIEIRSVLVVTDREESGARAFGDQVRGYLPVLGADLSWREVQGHEFADVEQLLALVREASPDLVCTYRNLHSTAWKYPYSLGEFVDVLTQVASPPILLLPHPEAGRAAEHALKNTNSVMAITSHLTGDDRLINYAVRFTQKEGTLFLTHIEDESIFDEYLSLISKIPTLDTDIARHEIREQALKEPADYIRSCQQALKANQLTVSVKAVVRYGQRLSEYKQLIEDHRIDLLVLNTRDEDQSAMHGLAYPLAVELRHIPLLML